MHDPGVKGARHNPRGMWLGSGGGPDVSGGSAKCVA
jgi:hypothetical protein